MLFVFLSVLLSTSFFVRLSLSLSLADEVESSAIAIRSASASSSPHILFIVVDDLGWRDISYHDAEYQTPVMDSLFADGIELSNYYVHPSCSPTRASLLTGKYAWKTGLQSIRTINAGSTQHIPFDTPTVAELLQSAGYETHGLGKWHLGYAAWNMTPIERGFDTFFGFFQGKQFYYNHTLEIAGTPQKLYTGYDFWDNQQIYTEAIGVYSTTLIQNRMRFIVDNYMQEAEDSASANANAKPKPMFFYLSFQTVHSPVELPPKTYPTCSNITTNGRRAYCNKVLFLDEAIGNIIGYFKQNQLWSNTLLALTTDNGGMPPWSPYSMGHSSFGCNLPLRAGKATLFEGGIKGIALFSGPLVKQYNLAGTQSQMLTHSSDWLPTFVTGIADMTLPANIDFDGRDMWSVLISQNSTHPKSWNRTTLYVNIDSVNMANVVGNFSAIIHDQWKYINGSQIYTNYYYCNQTSFGVNNLTQTMWLFNISGDPYETTNLMHEYPEVVRKLQQMIDEQVANGGFMPDQDRTVYNQSLPGFHNDVWAPWL